MLVPPGSSDKVWSVIRSKPARESFLVDFLGKDGLAAYCPMISRKGDRSKPRPCFTGYVFVRLSPRFELSRVSGAPGVIRPLMFGGELAAVEPDVIERFRDMESPAGVIELERPQRFRKGDVVKICSGSFAGLRAVVTDWLPEKERVRLLLDYFGREVALEADEALLA
ncbi:MAG TPA: transcription termination/antitermination NusG family protein [Acidobacteriota bacterium]|jgi:transcriptional antiterminator RfaH|nr:transcription termination/antitermination NusG family protein [Acidobacteriota bacterium]HNT17571.1 transcription termination/antitermination NusG family protein [Acidobacteriota bacterium]HPA26968.1 transcription termination/antitermination NusG family protein [Acidobacteriota bacterium]HQO19686.1 transcription termination/antitermination NusG family protein [Acidobacteriota bacterium]HQQ46545.1 transcription termination/antitermination NusG family protein [Acidobacteriota bacterium]